MKNKKIKNKIYICIILIVAVLLSSLFLLQTNKAKFVPSEKNEEISSANLYNEEPKSLDYWQEINNDVKFMLNINGKAFPVLYNEDRYYYLRRDIFGKDDVYGSVFLDNMTTNDTQNLIIYGHSTFNKDLIFTFVDKYFEDENYYKNNSNFSISTNDVNLDYKIIGIKKLDTNIEPWLGWYIPNTDDGFDIVEFGTMLLENSDKVLTDKLKVNKPFITLVTCDMDSYNKQSNDTRFRYLLFAQQQ